MSKGSKRFVSLVLVVIYFYSIYINTPVWGGWAFIAAYTLWLVVPTKEPLVQKPSVSSRVFNKINNMAGVETPVETREIESGEEVIE